jgi:cystathionine beta-lyase
MKMRFERHDASARELAAWFKARPEIAKVLHPACEDCPGHAFWQRDFMGAGGLFSVVFDARLDEAQVDRMVDALTLFGIGYSWGGPNSLVMPYRINSLRDQWEGGVLVRFNVGLEDPADLIADLAQAFDVL